MRRSLSDGIIDRVRAWNERVQKCDDNQHFKIELDFVTGRAGNDVIAFDSVIAHYTCLHVLGADFFNLSYDHDEYLPIQIPLRKIQFDDNYFYMCGYLNDIPNKVTYWVKRFEKSMLSSVDAVKVSIQQGRFKSYKMPLFYSDQKKYVIWGTGNIDMIKEVLPNTLHVGKKAAVGFGECSYTITALPPGKKSFALMCNGYLQRPLPVAFCEARNWKPMVPHTMMRPISPPYFGTAARAVGCYEGGLKLRDNR